ncbi:hypothetical protein P9112_004781 [Eukaryota sp. TZLM1-RC]
MVGHRRRNSLQIEDWIAISSFYTFEASRRSLMTKSLECVGILCERGSSPSMLSDLVKFSGVAFHGETAYLNQLQAILTSLQHCHVWETNKQVIKDTAAIADYFKQTRFVVGDVLVIPDDYLSYGMLYNVLLDPKHQLQVDTFKHMFMWRRLRHKLTEPLWIAGFKSLVQRFGAQCCIRLIEDLVDVSIPLLNQFLSTLSRKMVKNPSLSVQCCSMLSKVIPSDRIIDIIVPCWSRDILRAVLIHITICSYCLHLSNFKVRLRKKKKCTEMPISVFLNVLHVKFAVDEEFKNTVINHFLCNLNCC